MLNALWLRFGALYDVNVVFLLVLRTVDRKWPQTHVSVIFFTRRSGQVSEKGKTLRNGKVPGRTGAHAAARAAEGGELRSTSVSDPVRREESGHREIGRRGWRPPDSGAA